MGRDVLSEVRLFENYFFTMRLGWDEGVAGACVGEKRKLIIPSGKAYGRNGIPGVIGQDATLVFNVQLLSINNKNEL